MDEESQKYLTDEELESIKLTNSKFKIYGIATLIAVSCISFMGIALYFTHELIKQFVY